MAVFGAAMMGGRFYAQLVLAFIAFLIVGSRTITEKDAKWLVFFILGGSVISAAYNIASYFLFGAVDDILGGSVSGEEFYTWHQNLGTPAAAFAFLLFAWKKPRDIFGLRNPGLTILYLFAIGITLYSGKRMGLVAIFIAPTVGAIVYRQYSYILIGGVAAIILFAAIIFGHGEYFKFPLQMQRTLSWLPADWDSQFRQMEGGQDTFRASLRRFAMENIKRDPIIGRGFGIQYSEIIGLSLIHI